MTNTRLFVDDIIVASETVKFMSKDWREDLILTRLGDTQGRKADLTVFISHIHQPTLACSAPMQDRLARSVIEMCALNSKPTKQFYVTGIQVQLLISFPSELN